MSEDTTNPAQRKVSAFASARIDFAVCAEVGLDELQAMRPAWSEEECTYFLKHHGDTIGREMAIAGTLALAALLEGAVMPTNTEDDDAAIALREVADRFHVRDEKTAAWVVRKIVEERAHRERVADWFEAETRRSEHREQFLLNRFGGELAEWVRQKLKQQYGNRRSVQLPTGTVGFRTEPVKIIFTDEKTLIAWCRQHLPSAIRVVESILKTEITAHLKSTGECPDGAELGGGGNKFYIK